MARASDLSPEYVVMGYLIEGPSYGYQLHRQAEQEGEEGVPGEGEVGATEVTIEHAGGIGTVGWFVEDSACTSRDVRSYGDGMHYPIGEVARRTGITVRTLHHYDAIGLLSPPRRSRAGYRLYGGDEEHRLRQEIIDEEGGDLIRAYLRQMGPLLIEESMDWNIEGVKARIAEDVYEGILPIDGSFGVTLLSIEAWEWGDSDFHIGKVR